MRLYRVTSRTYVTTPYLNALSVRYCPSKIMGTGSYLESKEDHVITR